LVVLRLFHHCNKYLRETNEKEERFIFKRVTVSELSVHGQLAALLCACDEVKHHGVRSMSPHSDRESKRKIGGRGKG
jgi:hypothetical protein